MFKSILELVEQTTHKYSSLNAFSVKTGFRTKTYTFSQIEDFVKRIPAFLKEHDIRQGDKIIILSLNRPEYTMLILGSFLSGVTIVPVDYRTNHETILKFIHKTGAKAVFTTALFKPLFSNVRLPFFMLENLTSDLEIIRPAHIVNPDPEDLAALLFTSGTTGEPKGTMIRYKNILAAINSIRSFFILPEKLRILSILPLSHVLEMFGGMMTAYTFGCHIHYLERINSITIIQALNRYRIEGMAVVPQMLRLLMQNIEHKVDAQHARSGWDFMHLIAAYAPFSVRRALFKPLHERMGGSFKFFASGSAPLEIKLARKWQNLGIKILEGYGASETTGFIAANTLFENHIGTVGKMIPHLKYKLTESKELLVSGDNVVTGYFENEEKTKESFVDGYFNTGDIVQIEKNGVIKIVGRDKFKIVLPDGKKVYPEDIEKHLNNHPEISDSCVLGIPTDEGEIVHAEVMTKSHHLDEIIRQVNAGLNPHEQIMDFAKWTDTDFPRNKTLKIDREALKQAVISKNKSAKNGDKKETIVTDRLTTVLSIVSGKPTHSIHPSSVLSTDLKMDSLKRIEMLALIEEELGVSVEELKIKSGTTVAELKTLVEHGKEVHIDDGEKLDRWQFTDRTDKRRLFMQEHVMFPAFNLMLKVKGKNLHNLDKIKTPQLFIFNHVGMHDVANILRILPEHIRAKLAIAANAGMWHDKVYYKHIIEGFANAFPFVKAESHNSMRGNFERVGELLDKGYNILISPEGNISPDGQLLPFHTGAGYIAVEMGVPVTPFKINGYFELWPNDEKRALNIFWPKKSGVAEVVVGEPIIFNQGTSYEDATEIMRQAVLNLE